MTVWVKVCGMTHPDDVEAAVSAGADAIGFVTWEGSSRWVTPADAASLGDGVPVTRVLVTVDQPTDALLDAARRAGVDGVQPAGRHSAAAAAAAAQAGLFVLRPVAVAGPVDLSHVPADQMPFLDAKVAGRPGGTGRTWDWELAEGIARDYVLAGGLGPGTVAEAIRRLSPWGVDASSRLEAAPGRKDPDKVRRFVEEAKHAWS